MNIKVVTLERCSKCQNFKEELTKSGIRFDEMTCEKYPDTCDSLESLVNSDSYPMAMLVSDKNKIFEVIFLAKNYSQLQEGVKNNAEISYVPQYSIDNILNYISKRLNLNK